MGLPTTASRSIEIAAPPEAVYDLVSDITRTGEWSPECRSCAWVDDGRGVGARFRGQNRSGLLRWATTAEVIEADRPRTFAFGTLFKDGHATRWRYEVVPSGPGSTLTESFESVTTPFFIQLAERFVLRNRQQQLEAGITATLERIRGIAESAD